MSKEYGEKSFNPSPFAVYRNTCGSCGVNVWNIFKRKLPCQIALVCYDSAKTIDEICLETGTPAAYIEDEIEILIHSELLISPVKDKYRTNFFILRNNALKQLKEQFIKMYSEYIPIVIKTFEKYLPEMKQCDIFKYDAEDMRYKWFFDNMVIYFANDNIRNISEDEYMTLADGAKGFVFAQEENYLINTKGHCGFYYKEKNLYIHASAPSNYHFQRIQKELIYDNMDINMESDYKKISALYNIYKGDIKENEKELYAQLIEQGYVFKENDKLICDVAVHTKKSKELFNKINGDLNFILTPLCKEIYENISRIVTSTIPPQLKQYIHGYTITEIQFYAGIFFRETVYNKSFLTIPEDSDKTPVSCWIDEL